MVFGNLPVLYMTTLYNYTHSNKVLNAALCFYKVSMKPLPCFSRNTIQSGWSPCPTTPPFQHTRRALERPGTTRFLPLRVRDTSVCKGQSALISQKFTP